MDLKRIIIPVLSAMYMGTYEADVLCPKNNYMKRKRKTNIVKEQKRLMEDPRMIEFDDVLHLFATIGFEGEAPKLPTASIRGINGEFGRSTQVIIADAVEDYFEKFKEWCRQSIKQYGEGEVRSRFYKLFELGILDFQYEDLDDGDMALILMIWDGEKYEDYRMLGNLINDPFIVGGEE